MKFSDIILYTRITYYLLCTSLLQLCVYTGTAVYFIILYYKNIFFFLNNTNTLTMNYNNIVDYVPIYILLHSDKYYDE